MADEPRVMQIDDYFEICGMELGSLPVQHGTDDNWLYWPVTCVCGMACVRVIHKAAEFMAVCTANPDKASDLIVRAAFHECQVICRG